VSPGYHPAWQPPHPLTDAQVGWLAGIIDGEGCITISKQKAGAGGRVNPSYRLFLKVTMGHLEAVERVRDLLDVGSVHVQNARQRHDGVLWNQAWAWWVSANEAAAVLRFLRPHLVVKAAEADVAMEFAALPRWLTGGANGNLRKPPEFVAAQEEFFCRLRDLKPSARFRKALI
jgi:hypothetical protein